MVSGSCAPVAKSTIDSRGDRGYLHGRRSIEDDASDSSDGSREAGAQSGTAPATVTGDDAARAFTDLGDEIGEGQPLGNWEGAA
jgi:hypothetical protein